MFDDFDLLPTMEAEWTWFWIETLAASAVGAISSGGGTDVRCFFFGWTGSLDCLLLDELELDSDSSSDIIKDG